MIVLKIIGGIALIIFGVAGFDGVQRGIRLRKQHGLATKPKDILWWVAIFTLDACAIGGGIYLAVSGFID